MAKLDIDALQIEIDTALADKIRELEARAEKAEAELAARNRRHTDAALGEADDYPGTPLARLDEAVLGRELIAWAVDPANVYACESYTVKFCVFCGATGGHETNCLHLRARALRDSDAN